MIRPIYSELLCIGNALDARDLRLLYEHRIAAVVDLAINEQPARLARDMLYLRVPLVDGDGNAEGVIETALRLLVTLVQNNIRTLVACSAGMSRSPALAAAAIALLTNRPPETCLTEIIANAPHDVSPILWSRIISVYNQMTSDASRIGRESTVAPMDENPRNWTSND